MLNSTWFYNLLCGTLILFSLVFFISLILMFHKEKNYRGLQRAILLLTLFLVLILVIWIYHLYFVLWGIILLTGVSALLFIIPFRPKSGIIDSVPVNRIDERDIMFSRNELKEGTIFFKDYYQRNPEKKELDDRFRKEPGLLAAGSKYYHEKIFSLAKVYFDEVKILHQKVKGVPAKTKIDIDPKEFSKSIKASLLNNGAISVGICSVKDYHFYTHKGRGEEYGNEIGPHHKYAIAFTVEMDFNRVKAAPRSPIVLESATQYLNAGRMAVELAEKIREMGFDARAHIDGNYEVVCPLVARDAGLGEIGRMGILMTPELGPRVRIGVVTTDLELQEDNYRKDDTLTEFCKWCKKCADCCPGNSISKDDPKLIKGVRRWQIDQESCYTFWCKAGTDCGRCMSVCPYSHPNHGMHRIIRFGIKKSRIFRYLAVGLDDFFYGKRPESGKIPDDIC